MKISNVRWVRKLFDSLPEDVKAVLMLFPDSYNFEPTEGGSGSDRTVCFDIWDETKEDYLFQQDWINEHINRRRFVSWVRAGMPGGYGDPFVEGGEWLEETEDDQS